MLIKYVLVREFNPLVIGQTDKKNPFKFNLWVRASNILSWRFDHDIFSTAILSVPILVQEGQLSVSGERMCTTLVNRLEDEACAV